MKSREMKRTAIAGILILMALLLASGSLSCSSGGYSGPEESITIGTIAWEPSALIYIAESQNYFKAKGLNVTIKSYDTGLATTDAMLNGNVDIAACAEYIITERAFQGENICNLTTIAKSENVFIIGRTDKGVKTDIDLKGKKIGVPRHTIAEFYLGRFLEMHGMSLRDVSIIDILPPQLGDALAGGSVDAVVAWQPYADQIEKQLANKTKKWPAQCGQAMYWNITCLDAFAASRPQLVNRILSSLAQAENYLTLHPDESKTIVQKHLNYDVGYVAAAWPEHHFSLSLDQPLILAMEDEARWMISNNLTTEKTVPNFLDFIYADGLKAVKPSAFRIAGK
jgi:ABC-type nitrate/sulfonate/bicarbonate transport system substrate-binding protein